MTDAETPSENQQEYVGMSPRVIYWFSLALVPFAVVMTPLMLAIWPLSWLLDGLIRGQWSPKGTFMCAVSIAPGLWENAQHMTRLIKDEGGAPDV